MADVRAAHSEKGNRVSEADQTNTPIIPQESLPSAKRRGRPPKDPNAPPRKRAAKKAAKKEDLAIVVVEQKPPDDSSLLELVRSVEMLREEIRDLRMQELDNINTRLEKLLELVAELVVGSDTQQELQDLMSGSLDAAESPGEVDKRYRVDAAQEGPQLVPEESQLDADDYVRQFGRVSEYPASPAQAEATQRPASPRFHIVFKLGQEPYDAWRKCLEENTPSDTPVLIDRRTEIVVDNRWAILQLNRGPDGVVVVCAIYDTTDAGSFSPPCISKNLDDTFGPAPDVWCSVSI